MRIPLPEYSLNQFIHTALHNHRLFASGVVSRSDSPIYVIGNPSADLDSIVSALVYSYFANKRVPHDCPRQHVPVINLDNVSAGAELRRLRPELFKALELSQRDAGKNLEDGFLTVADFIKHLKTGDSSRQLQADSVLVDWNALPIRYTDAGRGSLPGLDVEFNVLGCIDHHVDEGFLPDIADTQPNRVTPAGSCTSLVISELEKMGLWQKSDAASAHEEEVAKLALSPVLIDTANLTSKDKVTKFDTLAYDYLLPKARTTEASWDADKFYSEVHETKQNSLELLTLDEILGRDYKEWAEKPARQADQPPLKIGICSMVKSLPWVVRKAGDPQAFLDCLEAFAADRKLDVVAVMTAFSASTDGQFSRELLVYGRNSRGVDSLESFVSDASSELGLETWYSLDGNDLAQDIKDRLVSRDEGVWTRVWVQTNIAKSRKQVAPLIRGAAASL